MKESSSFHLYSRSCADPGALFLARMYKDIRFLSRDSFSTPVSFSPRSPAPPPPLSGAGIFDIEFLSVVHPDGYHRRGEGDKLRFSARYMASGCEIVTLIAPTFLRRASPMRIRRHKISRPARSPLPTSLSTLLSATVTGTVVDDFTRVSATSQPRERLTSINGRASDRCRISNDNCDNSSPKVSRLSHNCRRYCRYVVPHQRGGASSLARTTKGHRGACPSPVPRPPAPSPSLLLLPPAN